MGVSYEDSKASTGPDVVCSELVCRWVVCGRVKPLMMPLKKYAFKTHTQTHTDQHTNTQTHTHTQTITHTHRPSHTHSHTDIHTQTHKHVIKQRYNSPSCMLAHTLMWYTTCTW